MTLHPGVTRLYGLGFVPGREGEFSTRLTSSRMRGGQHRTILGAHGLNGTAADILQRGGDFWALAERGYPVLYPDLGGSPTFGNDDSIDAVGDCVNYLLASGLGKSDKGCLKGGSMGTLCTHNYTLAHPEKVSSLVESLFVASIPDIWDDDSLGARDKVEDSYNTYPGGWTAAMATHNPIQLTAAMAATDVPVHVYNNFSDQVCEWRYALAYMQAVNALNPDQVRMTDTDYVFCAVHPTSAVGADDDAYLHLRGENQVLYRKAAGAWDAGLTITTIVHGVSGPPSIAANWALDGNGVHTDVSSNGDYAVDYLLRRFYGPKAAGAWPGTYSPLAAPLYHPMNPTLTANGHSAVYLNAAAVVEHQLAAGAFA